jgi:hypothetical protein
MSEIIESYIQSFNDSSKTRDFRVTSTVLNEEEKTRVDDELAKSDASAASLAAIFVEFAKKRHIQKDEKRLLSEAMDLAETTLYIKRNRGHEMASKIFAKNVDRPGTATLWSYLDPNMDGRVSVKEFLDVVADGNITNVLRALDRNHDGHVTFAEATQSLQNAGIKLEGHTQGGFEESAAVLGRALATVGVEFRALPKAGGPGLQYVAVVPPSSDTSGKLR